MGKEAQFIEAAASGNKSRVEQFLKGHHSKLKRLLSKERLLDLLDPTLEDPDQKISTLTVHHKHVTRHIDVNCTDENGYTPLMHAVLNGHKEVAYLLVEYSANVGLIDLQGNTALHLAAWQNRAELVQLLLSNGAKADVPNLTGNTPLHYACQYCPVGRPFAIIKLLQKNCDTLAKNKDKDTPLDLAVRYDRREAVSLIVDSEPKCLENTKCFVEACRNGRTEVVEIFLEAGMDPNCSDTSTGSCPLHEAVRFFRKEVTELLLQFGAEINQKSANDETPLDLIEHYSPEQNKAYMELFRKYRGGAKLRVPRVLKEKTQQTNGKKESENFSTMTHPLIKSKTSWLQPNKQFCSAWTQKHPPTCLLDGDLQTYWRIPAAGAYNWVVFDLGGQHTLSGIRIYGWASPYMLYTFIVETGKSLSGPWKKEQKFKAELVGSEDLQDPAAPQDFRGFYATSRYWRITVADNYGETTTHVAGIEFYGIEEEVIEWFEDLKMKHYLTNFVNKGYNQLSELALLTGESVSKLVSNNRDKATLLSAASDLRREIYTPSSLQWASQPISKVTVDKIMPEISVFSAPYTVGELTLHCDTAEISGNTKAHLVSKDTGFLSKAVFKGISLRPDGKHILEVRSVADPSVNLKTPEPITVVPPPMRNSEIGKVFDDFEKMLEF